MQNTKNKPNEVLNTQPTSPTTPDWVQEEGQETRKNEPLGTASRQDRLVVRLQRAIGAVITPSAHRLYETKTYDFKYCPTNRPINENHVLAIAASMEVLDMHKENPIIVNAKGLILDGQHRYEARKLLEKPVFFVIAENLTTAPARMAAITTLNNKSKNWALKDYLNSYCKQGKAEYIKFQTLVEQNPFISVSQLLSLASGNQHRVTADFKAGTLDLSNISIAETVAKWVGSLATTGASSAVLKNTQLLGAIKALIQSEKVELPTLMKKVAMQPKALVPTTTVHHAIDNLLAIYNFKSRAPIGLSDILSKSRLERTRSMVASKAATREALLDEAFYGEG